MTENLRSELEAARPIRGDGGPSGVQFLAVVLPPGVAWPIGNARRGDPGAQAALQGPASLIPCEHRGGPGETVPPAMGR